MKSKLARCLARLFPAGWPWQTTVEVTLCALLVSWCSAVLGFLIHFDEAKIPLYVSLSERILDRSTPIAPFAMIFGRGLLGFWIVALCLALLPLFHYLWHWQGSKSIYLMRRLPRRGELWRRCLAGPAVLLALTLLAAALAVLLCILLYQTLTPAGHLPENPWEGIGGILCWF